MNIKTIVTIASIGLLLAACDNADERDVVQTTEPATTFKDSNPPTPPVLPEQPDYADTRPVTADTRPSTTAGDQSMRNSNVNRYQNNEITDFEGKEVVSATGEELGEVDRVVTERATGKNMAVIGLEGIVGDGMKEVAVPLGQLMLSPDGEKVVSRLSKRELESMPDVDIGDFTDFTDSDY